MASTRILARRSLASVSVSTLHGIKSNRQYASVNPERSMHSMVYTRPRSPSTNLPSISFNLIDDSSHLYYPEEMLEDFYKNLLASDAPFIQESTSAGHSRYQPLAAPATDLMLHLEKRLSPPLPSHETSLSTLLLRKREKVTTSCLSISGEPHVRLLKRIAAIVRDHENKNPDDMVAGTSYGLIHPVVIKAPLISISYKEWFDIVRHCVHLKDMRSAVQTIEYMIKSGRQPPVGFTHWLMEELVLSRSVREFETLIKALESNSIPIDPLARELHIKVYVRDRSLKAACDIIYSYEKRGLHPAMKTYHLVIGCLFARDKPDSRALAWDMFAHMRYVAHPVPDAQLYGVMLRACASAPIPQAERALDLFTEMRIDNGLAPTRDTYNWTILACARAAQDFTQDAFRLAQEMLDAFHSGSLHLRPDLHTFCALLESAKRNGDLVRARWILAEVVKAHQEGDESLFPDEEVMAHVFQVYAAYQPPFKRSAVRLVKDATEFLSDPLPLPGQQSAAVQPMENVSSLSNAFDPPQSHAEIIAEAEALFTRIQYDSVPRLGSAQERAIFARVAITPNLLNSVLSVYLSHSTLSRAKQMFHETFTSMGVPWSSRTCLLLLQKCGRPESSQDHDDALSFAQDIWKKWIQREDNINSSPKGTANSEIKPTSPRTIEKLWAAMIKVLAKEEKIVEAIDLVKDFERRYPPSLIKSPMTVPISNPSPSPTIRVQLDASQPLIRLSTSVFTSDALVPPHLMFQDVEVLHHKLLLQGRMQDVGYLKWLTLAYSGALRTRRERTLAKLKSKALKKRSSPVIPSPQ